MTKLKIKLKTNKGNYSLLAAFAMGFISWLSSRSFAGEEDAMIIAIGSGLLFLLVFSLIKVFMVALNGKTFVGIDKIAAYKTVDANFALILPFAVMAGVAVIVLHWNSALAFASAAIMITVGSCGSSLLKIGGGKIRNMLFPSLMASLVSAGYMIIFTLLAKIGGVLW
jgi:ABC-type transport system involved in multi-copper enzyme maturation permease subunit